MKKRVALMVIKAAVETINLSRDPDGRAYGGLRPREEGCSRAKRQSPVRPVGPYNCRADGHLRHHERWTVVSAVLANLFPPNVRRTVCWILHLPAPDRHE